VPWILASVAFALLCYEIPTLVTAVLWPLWHNPNAIQTDFHYYYQAAQRFAANRQQLYMASDDVIAGFAYPPPAIVPFLALARLPLGVALVALTVASYAALGVTIRQWLGYVRRHGFEIDRRTTVLVSIIVLALGPAYMNAIFGQVNMFVLASTVAFACWLELPAAAGSMLAMGIWLKIYPVVVAAIALWERRAWRAIGWAIVAGLAIAVLLLPVVPWSAYQTFVSSVLPARVDKTAIHITNQSLVAFLERFTYPPDEFLNWTGHEAVTVSGVIRAINLGAAAAAVLMFWRRAVVSEPARAGSVACIIALVGIVAPLGWGHTYVMAIPLVMLHVVVMRHAPPLPAGVAFVCIVALMIPAGRHLPIDAAPAWLQNLVYSRYLIATVILCALPLDTRRQRA
jgi:alpha-1,2-mannosyltransferase